MRAYNPEKIPAFESASENPAPSEIRFLAVWIFSCMAGWSVRRETISRLWSVSRPLLRARDIPLAKRAAASFSERPFVRKKRPAKFLRDSLPLLVQEK